MKKVMFVAEIQSGITHEKEYEIVAASPSKLISALMLQKHEAGFTLTSEKLLMHLFEGGPNGTGAAYCEKNVCITIRCE